MEVVGKIFPQNGSGSTLSSEYIDMNVYDEVDFNFALGSVLFWNDSSSITLRVRESKDDADLGGQTISKFDVVKGGTDDNSNVLITVNKKDLSASYRYLRGQVVTSGGGTNIVTMVAIGRRASFDASDKPSEYVAVMKGTDSIGLRQV